MPDPSAQEAIGDGRACVRSSNRFPFTRSSYTTPLVARMVNAIRMLVVPSWKSTMGSMSENSCG